MKAKNNVRIRYVSCITVFVLITVIISGCAKSISRSKAAEIISQSEGFPKFVYYSLPVAKVSEGNSPSTLIRHEEYYTWRVNTGELWYDLLRAWTKLESMGFISLKRLGKLPSGGRFFEVLYETVEISLTDKGRTIFTHDKNHFWKTKLGKKVFVEVTGIFKRDDGTAIVEYTWEYDISPVGNAVLDISVLRGKNVATVYKEEVVMRKYDDGWRIVD